MGDLTMMPEPFSGSVTPIIPPIIPPKPTPLILVPEPRAAAVWPARTWTDAEKTTAAMMNGVRDQLNDTHTSQSTTTASLIPTLYAKKSGQTSSVTTDWSQPDFIYLPALAPFDTVVVEFRMHHGVNPAPRFVMYGWNVNASYALFDQTMPPSGAGTWSLILRRHPNSDQYLYRTVMGGSYTAGGWVMMDVYQIYDWKALALYWILSPIPNSVVYWGWTVTVFPNR
jgi:hypothetical protein